MIKPRLRPLSVYVDAQFAKEVAKTALAKQTSISVFIRTAIERQLRNDADERERLVAGQRYLTVGVDAILDHLDAKLRPAVRKVHATRFGSSSDAQ